MRKSNTDIMSDQRNMEYYIQEDQSLVPIRWMPPEAVFYKKYSVKSDVWSFGVTLWEIFTLSLLPYSEIAHSDVATRKGLKFLNPEKYICKDISKLQVSRRFLTSQRVRKGYRLNEPIYPLNRTVNGEIFQLMKDCWNKDKYARPEFSEIKERLKCLEPRLLERDLNQQNPHYQPI